MNYFIHVFNDLIGLRRYLFGLRTASPLAGGVFLALLALLLAGRMATVQAQPAATATVSKSGDTTKTPTATVDRWQEIQLWTPYPHTTPLPPRKRTPVDGIYVRFDPRVGERTPCRRCPPYPPEGGVWKLHLSEGIFRVYHPRTGWRSLGSFMVDGDKITLFNDPQCHRAVGHFDWTITERALSFDLIDDDCELGTRAKNFTQQPWQSCQPPNREAAVSGHWSAPAGCE